MSELLLLKSLLLFGYLLAPLVTNKLLLKKSNIYAKVHMLTFGILLASLFFNFSYGAFVWPLFCVFGSILFLKNEYKSIFTTSGIAKGIPFVFSLISSLWFVSAVNDFQLLGYNPSWSYYAALHGCFLGWVFVACLVYLSEREEKSSKAYLLFCYISLLFFLCVAFGIDGVPYLKKVGVVGLSVIVPLAIALYAFNLRNVNKRAMVFACLGLTSIVVTMLLALMNEFWIGFPKILFGLPTMVLLHGVLNVVIVIPFFYISILLRHLNKASS